MILSGYDTFTADVTLVSYDEAIHDKALRAQYLAWLNDMDVVRPIQSQALMLPKDMTFIDESFARFTTPNAKGFFIKWMPENRYAGTIKLDKITDANRSAEMGIMLGEKDLWGHRIGEKAFRILMRYAFETMRLHRIWGGTAENNLRMKRLFLKCGFLEEGLLRDCSYFEGKYYGSYRFSILRTEWETANKPK